MHRPMLSMAQFRHVVFPAEARRRRLALNLAGDAGPHEPGPCAGLSAESGAFLRWLFSRAGLDARQYRAETLQRRLPACLRALGARSPAHARALLEQGPSQVPAAVSAMLVGVTAFFRDPPVFALLRDQVLPQLAGPRAGLAVWSAGCSDGAELYSVALLLAEAGFLAGSYLLGTDCRPDALARAKAGAFDAAAVRNLPPCLLARYFHSRGAAWEVRPALRRALRWRTADLLKTQEPGFWDAILCRNTTMYMRSEATGPLWERFESALRPGGVLVLGKAERPVGTKRLTPVGPCVYRRARG